MGNLFGNPKGKELHVNIEEEKMTHLKPSRAQLPKEDRKNGKVDNVVSRGHKNDLHTLIQHIDLYFNREIRFSWVFVEG